MGKTDLSDEELLELFCAAVKDQGTETPLWPKGAELCLQKDIENGANINGRSYLRAYLFNTINSRASKEVGLNLGSFEKYLREGVGRNILAPNEEIKMKAQIVSEGVLLYKEDRDRLLRDKNIRDHLDNLLLVNSDDEIQQNPKLSRLKRVLETYDRLQIIKEGNENLHADQELRKVLGAEVVVAIKEGITPHKKAIRELVARAKEKGLSAKQIKEAVHEARRIAREKAEKDKLQDKQNKLEKAGFVRNNKAKEI